MFRNAMMIGLLAAAIVAAPAFAETPAAAAPAAPGYTTGETSIGDLLDNPVTKAVLDKYMPGMSANPQIDMARGMTLKQIQNFAPDMVKDETLAQIDADLAKIPVKK